jgi:hypothetical protein
VDISSLLKDPDSNEAPGSPRQQHPQSPQTQQQQPQATSSPTSTTALGLSGPPVATLSPPTASTDAAAAGYPHHALHPSRPLTSPPGPPQGRSPPQLASVAALEGPIPLPPPPGRVPTAGPLSVSEGLKAAAVGIRAANAVKRGLQTAESPAKKQSKWSPDEDALIIELRGSGMKWEDISKRLPGRSAISCRLHYQNYLERRSEWDEERKNKLARLYER